MAQAFVVRDDLLTESPEKPVRVIGAYANTVVLGIDAHGANCTLITVADTLIKTDRASGIMTLLPTWRDDYKSVINAEAFRRINIPFPQYKQMNYNALFNEYQTQYGTDATQWPQDAMDFKVEYDRGWQYISDVRSASNAWTAMPVDPTSDSIWPPMISPIK